MRNVKGFARKNFSEISAGFTAVEGLLMLVLVGILGFTGWYVYNAHNKTTDTFANADYANSSTANYSKKQTSNSSQQATSQTATTELSSKGGEIKFTLPKDWQVDQRHDGGSACGFAASVDADGTCLLGVTFKTSDPDSINGGYLKLFQTAMAAREWYEKAGFVCSNPSSSPINGYQTYLCPASDGLSGDEYTMSNGGYLVYFTGLPANNIKHIAESIKFLK